MDAASYVTGVPLHRPVRRILYQIRAEVKNDKMTGSSRYEVAKETIWLWLKKKTIEMPELAEKVSSAMENGDNLVNIIYNGSVHIRVIALEDGECPQWGMSFSHPGIDVPTQVWETQAILTQDGDQVYLSAELSYCVAIAGIEPMPSVPGFVRDIAKNIGLFSCAPITESVWKINTDAQIDTLHQLLLDPSRNLPVVVLSEPDRRKWPVSQGPAPEYLISGEKIARGCFGRCIVVQMPYWPSFKWTKAVGKIWSVFDGGVRIYQPGLNMDEDDIYAHPLYLKSKILNWSHDVDKSSLQSFSEFLSATIRQEPTLLSSVQTRLTFSELFQKSLALMRNEATANEATLRQSYESEISDLKEQLKFHQDLAEDAYQKFDHYRKESLAFSAENHNLNALVENLRDALRASGRKLEIPIPDNYDEMEEWCSEYFPDRLIFTTRARRAIKDTQTLYADVPLVYRALCFLAQEYHDLKLGKIESHVMADKLNELQLQNRPSINLDQAGQYGKTYFYTDSDGKEHFVDMHLARGTDRDPHRTLRIYYYWDDVKNRVVVVSLTKHLTSSSS